MKELVVLENGKEITRINLNKTLYAVLNDNETFSPIKGVSIWQDNVKFNMSDDDYERTFRGFQHTKGLKKVMEL